MDGGRDSLRRDRARRDAAGIDGFETCRRLRRSRRADADRDAHRRDAVEDRIEGLDIGADDYLAKPFDFGELLARLRALARRGPTERDTVLRIGDLELDPATRRVRRGDRDIPLSTKEFQLLEVFMRHPGEVLSRYQLLEAPGTRGTSTARTSSTCTSATCARRWTAPSASTRSRLRGAGYRLKAG